MIFLSTFSAGLSVALPDCFLERRITCIMYTLAVLCIVCAGHCRRACGGLAGGYFLARGTGAGRGVAG